MTTKKFVDWVYEQEVTESVAQIDNHSVSLMIAVSEIADNETLTDEELLAFNVNLNKETGKNLHVKIDSYIKVDDIDVVCFVITGF